MNVTIENQILSLKRDDTTISVPLSRFPFLTKAGDSDLQGFQVQEFGIAWPALGEELTFKEILEAAFDGLPVKTAAGALGEDLATFNWKNAVHLTLKGQTLILHPDDAKNFATYLFRTAHYMGRRSFDNDSLDSYEVRVKRFTPVLVANIRTNKDEAKALLEEISKEFGEHFYRYYHQSLKVYRLQEETQSIETFLRGLGDGQPFFRWVEAMLDMGTGKEFELPRSNSIWGLEARGIVDAFLHMREFLRLVIWTAENLKDSQLDSGMPSEWAAVRYLYNIR